VNILRTKNAVKSALSPFRQNQQIIGFVPTMGALHDGHLALINQAKLNSEIVVVSIFINRSQFNNKQDFENYPKTLEEDIIMLEKAGVNYVFVPEHEELYEEPTSLILNFGELENTLEGAFRPGHFNGVGIVVSKLLNIVKPDKVYFGQKDLQQVAVIKRLVLDLSFDTEIHVVPTLREADGLAMSSRNFRLDHKERMVATLIFKCLSFAKDELLTGADWFEVKEKVTKRFWDEPLAKLEYFELVDTETLKKVNSLQSRKGISICTAAYIGEVRLIDNLSINC
jgi:pantoate--beta-alanine ligase